MVSPYNKLTENTRERIMGRRSSYYENKYYKSAEGNFYFYINRKGYYHIVKPCRIIYDGAFSHYQIVDYILTPQDTLKETKSYGCYETKEECIKRIEENMAVDA